MKWLTNLWKPYDKEDKQFLRQIPFTWTEGIPQETESHSSEELSKMGLVGIYKTDESELIGE